MEEYTEIQTVGSSLLQYQELFTTLFVVGFFFKVRKTVLESSCLYFDTQMQMTSYLRCKMPFSNKN